MVNAKVSFRVSAIASLCGFNQYTNKNKQKICDMLYQYYTSVYKDDVNDYVNDDEKFKNLIEKDESLKNKIDECKKIDIGNTKQLKDCVDKVIENIDVKKFELEEHDFLVNQINKTFTLQYGTFNESNTIKKLKDEYNIDVYENNDIELVKEFDRFIITGHIDGKALIDGEETLIEIKNRKNRLFKNLVLYEEIQVLFYMQMTGLKKAVLIEQYNDTMHFNYYNSQNKHLYTNCINRLGEIISFFEELNEDPELLTNIFINKNYDLLTMYLYWF